MISMISRSYGLARRLLYNNIMDDKQTEILKDAVRLIDDLCSAYRIRLLPDDQATRDAVEAMSGCFIDRQERGTNQGGNHEN